MRSPTKCRLEDCEREALFCGAHIPADPERAALVERIGEWMLAFEASGIGARHEYEGSDVPKALVAIARRLLIESRSLLEERRPRGEESVSDFDLSTLDLAEEIDDSQPAALANAARALAASPADSERAALVERIEEWRASLRGRDSGHVRSAPDFWVAQTAWAKRLLRDCARALAAPPADDAVRAAAWEADALRYHRDAEHHRERREAAEAALRALLAAIADEESNRDGEYILPQDPGCVRCTVGTNSTGPLCARHAAERLLEAT